MMRTLQMAWSDERGSARIETALTVPLVLLLSISVFEFGRAFQPWQNLTAAAREGAPSSAPIRSPLETAR